MAETDFYTKPHNSESYFPPNQQNPNKIYTHFMYKVAIFAIFLVIFPLLPSQAPEFINQSLHTRSWELVQLLLVGIAVSYGLFSRKNEDNDSSKIDNAHSYVSRFLQVSSVFADEAENSPGCEGNNKVQTWNSQYYRGEPVVVVAEESSVLEEERESDSRVVEKPLLLPVRSLKSRVLESEKINDLGGRGGSNSGSKRFSSKSRNGEFGNPVPLDLEERVEENVVLRSPIPWRSRSGRMEMREEIDGVPLPPSMEGQEFLLENNDKTVMEERRKTTTYTQPRELNSARPRPSRTNSSSPSLSESPPKNAENPKKKIYYKSPPPPPPPPPPPLYGRKPPLVKSNSTLSHADAKPQDLRRSIRSLPKNLSGTNTGFVEEFMRKEVVETDEESESESEDDVFVDGGFEIEEGVGCNGGGVSGGVSGDVGPDVDKKADEFIAKFREQIRLQRIESIKRSTGQIARNSLR